MDANQVSTEFNSSPRLFGENDDLLQSPIWLEGAFSGGDSGGGTALNDPLEQLDTFKIEVTDMTGETLWAGNELGTDTSSQEDGGTDSVTGQSSDVFQVNSAASSTVTFDGGSDADFLYLQVNEDDFLEFSTDGINFSTDLDLSTSELEVFSIFDTTSIDVSLGGGSDRLFVDASLSDALNATGGTLNFNAGGGEDLLFGPETAEVTWEILGADSGVVNERINFTGVENLFGGVDNEDTFIIAEGGSLSGTLDGGDGGFDILEMVGGAYESIVYQAIDAHSGSILLDDTLVRFAGLEPVTLGGTSTDVTIDLSFLDAGLVGSNDEATLLNDATDGSITLRSDNGTFEHTTFVNPTNSLTINLGLGDDTINLETLDDGFAASLTVEGDGGDDTINVTSALTLQNQTLKLDAETVSIQADVDTAGGKLDVDADTATFQANVSTGGGDIDVDADTISLDTSSNSVTLSTRQIAAGGDQDTNASTGNSGAIQFDGDNITIGSETGSVGSANIYAHVEDGSGFSAGDVALTVTQTAGTDAFDILLADVDTSKVGITLNDSTVKGGDIDFTATADHGRIWEDSAGLVDSLVETGISFLESFQFLAGVALSTTEAKIDLGQSSAIFGTTFDAVAEATSDATTQPLIYGLGLALGIVDTTAEVVVDGDVTTTGDTFIRSGADNTLEVVADGGAIGGAAGAVAVSIVDSTSKAQVGSNATFDIGGDLVVRADTVDRNFTMARSTSGSDGSVGVSVAVSDEDGSTDAFVDGDVSVGGNLTVNALQSKEAVPSSKLLVIPTVVTGVAAAAGVNTDSTGNLLDDTYYATISKVSGKVGSLLSSKSGDSATEDGKGQTSSFDAAAAVAVVNDVNNATARIGDDAAVDAQDEIEVKASIDNRPDVTASSSIDETTQEVDPDETADQQGSKFAGSAAVAVGDYTNNAEAYIGDNAQVDAGQALDVTSEALNDYEFAFGVNLWDSVNVSADFNTNDGTQVIDAGTVVEVKEGHDAGGEAEILYEYIGNKPGDSIDLSQEDFGNTSNWDELGSKAQVRGTTFIENLTTYLDDNFGLDNNAVDSWGQSTAKGSDVSIAGAVTVLGLNHTSDAYIGNDAQINQQTAFRTGSQSVNVVANSINEAVHFGGNIALPGISGNITKYTIDTSLGGFGTAGGDGAVGGTVLIIDYVDDVTAKIRDGVTLFADSLIVDADNRAFSISVSASGGDAGTFGFNGTFSLIKIDNSTYAYIDNAADITVGTGATAVEATDDTKIFNISGGVVTSENIGIGASIAVNEVERDTQAFIGNVFDAASDSDKPASGDTTLSTGGDVTVNAENTGFIGAYSLAASVVSKDTSTDPEEKTQTDSKSGGNYGFGVSADVSVNEIDDTAIAFIHDAAIVAADVDLNAKNDSVIQSFGGSVAIVTQSGTSVGIAGSYSQNTLTGSTQAIVDNSNLDLSGDLTAEATTDGDIVAIAASGSVTTSTKSGSVAGQVTVNDIANTTEAKIINGSDIISATNATLNAKDTSNIFTISGALAIGGKAGIGASVAINDIANTVNAFVADSDIDASGTLGLTANSAGDIKSITAAIGAALSTGMAATASVSLNEVSNTTQAYLQGTKTSEGIAADNGITVDAIDSSTISSIAGQAAVAIGKGAASIGVAFATNDIDNKTKAFADGAIAAAATGAIDLNADSTATIQTLSAGASISGGKFSASVTGAVSLNDIDNEISAYVINDSDLNAQQGIGILATEESTIKSLAGQFSLAVSIGAGIGGAVAYNRIGNTVRAYSDSSTLTSDGNILVSTSGEGTIETIAAGLSASGIAGVAGSVAINEMDNTLEAYVNGGTIDADGSVGVLADADNVITTYGGTIAAGAVGVGGSVVVNDVSNTTNAYVTDADITADGNDVMTVPVADGSNSTESTRGLAVIATSSEDVTVLIGTASVGGFGLAATVTVNSVEDETLAFVSGGTVNADTSGANAAQDVKVKAANETKADIKAGTIAIGGTAGIGAAVDVSSVKNTTGASIGKNLKTDTETASSVEAANDIGVTAVADKDVDSNVGAIGGGTFGVQGSVSVVNLGGAFTSDADDAINNEVDGDSTSDMLDDQLDGVDTASGETSDRSILDDLDTSTSVADSTTASIGAQSDLTAGNDITVESDETTDLDIISGAAAIGLTLAAGGAVGVANVSHNSNATVGSEATLNAQGDVNVRANSAIANADVTTYAGSAGLVGLGAAVSFLSSDNDATALIADDAVIENAADVEVSADSSSNLTAEGFGASAGALAVGIVLTDVSETGSTQAQLADGVEVADADDAAKTVDNLTVSADADVTTTSEAFAAAGGILSGAGADADAEASPTVSAGINDNAAIDVTGNVDVTADADVSATADAQGFTLGGVSVGASFADAKVTPELVAAVGSSEIGAGGDINVGASYNFNDSGVGIADSVESSSTASAGSLIAGILVGAEANITATPEVTVDVATGSDLDATNITVAGEAYNDVEADAEGNAQGLFSGGGNAGTSAEVVIGTVVVTTVGGSLTAQTDINVDSFAFTGVNATAEGKVGSDLGDFFESLFTNIGNFFTGEAGIPSILSKGGTVVQIDMVDDGDSGDSDSLAETNISANAQLLAGNELNITANNQVDIYTNSKMRASAFGVAFGAAAADVLVDADAIVNVGDGASLAATNTLKLEALNQIDAEANADGDVTADTVNGTVAVATRLDLGSTSDASDAKVAIGENTVLTAEDIFLTALNERLNQANANLISSALAEAFGSLTSDASAVSDGTAEVDSTVESGDGMQLTSANLTVQAESDMYLQRAPNAAADTVASELVTVIETIQREVKTKVCEYLPWPLDKVCDFVVEVVTETIITIVEVFDFSSEYVETGGTGLNVGDAIALNGDIFNIGANDKSLLVNADGSIDPSSNLSASVDSVNVNVDDIVTDGTVSIQFLASKGNIGGTATLHVNKLIGVVEVINNSDRNLVFNEIDMLGSDGDASTDPDITYESLNDFEYDIDDTIVDSTLDIQNNGSGDIIFNNAFSNVAAFMSIANQGGDIRATTPSDFFIEAGDVGDLVLEATNGSIGADGDRFNVRLVHGKLMPDLTDSTMPAELVAIAGDSMYLDVTGVNTTFAAFDAADFVDSIFLNFTAGNDIDVVVSESIIIPTDNVERSADGIYNLLNATSTSGDVTIDIQAGNLFLGTDPTLDHLNDANLTVGSVAAPNGQLSLTASGAILDDTETATDLTAQDIVLVADSIDALETEGDRIEVAANSSVNISNTGGLTVGGIGTTSGISANGDVTVTASSPIDVTENVTATGDITLTAGDSAATGDDLTIRNTAVVSTTGGSVTLRGGDDVTIENNDSTPVVSASGDVLIEGDFGDADAGTGSTILIAGEIQANSVTVNGNNDDDSVDATGTNAALAINGLDGNDTLTGSEASDTIRAGDDDDYITGDPGSDILDGEGGTDTANYSTSPEAVVVDLSVGTATDGFGNTDSLISIENVQGSDFDDEITGDANNNRLAGGAGNDTILAGEGDDTLLGEAGADLLDGGEGSDTASYATATEGINVNLLTGKGYRGDAAEDELISIENLEGSEFNDILRGDNNANLLSGNAGNDNIFSYGGDDTLLGGDDRDVLRGGDDNDSLDGGAGRDNILGDRGDDTIFGGDDGDIMRGGDGNDSLEGGDGNDTLLGDRDNDTLVGGLGNDYLRDTLGTNNFVLSDDSETDQIVNFSHGENVIELRGDVDSENVEVISENRHTDIFFLSEVHLARLLYVTLDETELAALFL